MWILPVTIRRLLDANQVFFRLILRTHIKDCRNKSMKQMRASGTSNYVDKKLPDFYSLWRPQRDSNSQPLRSQRSARPVELCGLINIIVKLQRSKKEVTCIQQSCSQVVSGQRLPYYDFSKRKFTSNRKYPIPRRKYGFPDIDNLTEVIT